MPYSFIPMLGLLPFSVSREHKKLLTNPGPGNPISHRMFRDIMLSVIRAEMFPPDVLAEATARHSPQHINPMGAHEVVQLLDSGRILNQAFFLAGNLVVVVVVIDHGVFGHCLLSLNLSA